MYRLGLTGSMATGKSTVLAMFADLGIPVYSADRAVHELYEGAAAQAIDALFPGVAPQGRVDRARLTERLVAEPDRLAALEALVHPLVREKMLTFLAEADADGAELAVLEIPLLFETAHAYPLDGVAVTVCSDDEQRRRAMARTGMTVEKFNTMVARQLPQAEKERRADFVIRTDVSLEDTRAAVEQIVGKCRRRAAEEKA